MASTTIASGMSFWIARANLTMPRALSTSIIQSGIHFLWQTILRMRHCVTHGSREGTPLIAELFLDEPDKL